MGIEKVLVMCSICKSIRVDKENNLWIKEKDNPELYRRLCDRYKGRISHTYCPEDYEEFSNK